MLYLVSTPIGNLGDITSRACSILKNSDYILCEDTRHSRPFLNKFEINKPLVSYHQHNEASRTAEVIDDLLAGKVVSLISDAGTPGISDPGNRLVIACYSHNIPVSPIPGPCAAIAALSASPLPTTRFQFIGFLPRTPGALKATLTEVLNYPGTTVCYESPQRLIKTLEALQQIAADAPVAIARELTKLHEQIVSGTAAATLLHFKENPPRGEIVLIVGHYEVKKFNNDTLLSPAEHVNLLLSQGFSRNEAIKQAAKARSMHRREFYALLI